MGFGKCRWGVGGGCSQLTYRSDPTRCLKTGWTGQTSHLTCSQFSVQFLLKRKHERMKNGCVKLVCCRFKGEFYQPFHISANINKWFDEKCSSVMKKFACRALCCSVFTKVLRCITFSVINIIQINTEDACRFTGGFAY